VSSLASALSGVHIVISCLYTIDHNTTASAQLNLFTASQSAGVTRFAPSEFTYAKAGNTTMDWYAAKVVVWEEVVKSGLEYTAFRNGQFFTYLGHGSPHPDVIEEGFAGALNFAFIVDLSKELLRSRERGRSVRPSLCRVHHHVAVG
jgi:hypothetical protein